MLTQHHAHRILIFLGIMLIFSMAVLGACSGSSITSPPSTPGDTGSPPPSTDNSTPPSSEETIEEWVPDGVIDDGEYAASNSYDNYTICWRADDQYIYIGITAETTGWVAMAVQPGSKMKDADMVLGFVDGDETTVYDQYSTGTFGPHSSDAELGGTDDILDYGGSESGGLTTIEFKRALNTGDEYDLPFSTAYGSSDNPESKHSARGYGEINL
jgi:hypothetical protein